MSCFLLHGGNIIQILLGRSLRRFHDTVHRQHSLRQITCFRHLHLAISQLLTNDHQFFA